MSIHEQIIEREFKNATGAQNVAVTILSDDEIIRVVADGHVYLMHIGSDDDGFEFDGINSRVTFPFPSDWEGAR
jgi:hypothetical protein